MILLINNNKFIMAFSNYNDSKRNKIVNIFLNIINIEKVSRQIEQSIYNYTIK